MTRYEAGTRTDGGRSGALWSVMTVIFLLGGGWSIAPGLTVAAVVAIIAVSVVVAVANGPGRPPRR